MVVILLCFVDQATCQVKMCLATGFDAVSRGELVTTTFVNFEL